MTGFLKFVGLLNAAIWFGAAVSFTFATGPAVFSQDMKDLLLQNYPKYSGAVAQIIIARYFRVQLICGVIALLHLVVEHFYFGKTAQRLRTALIVALFSAGLVGGYGLQPWLKQLHKVRYDIHSSPAMVAAAAQSFRAWHGVAQGINLLALCGLAVYVWGIANDSEPTRFVGTPKFRTLKFRS